MKKLIGLIVSLMLLTGFLAGCAKAPAQNSSTGMPEGTPATTETSKPEDTPAKTEVSGGAVETAWPRTYVDSLGNEVILEKQPERVVSIFHGMYHDYMYALGIYPVGVAGADTFLAKWSAFDQFLGGHPVVDVGSTGAANLELLLELEPDVIIGMTTDEGSYEELSKIAPTILLDYGQLNADWKHALGEFAEIFGKEDMVDAVISETEGAVAKAADELDDFRSKGGSVIFLGINEKDIWPYIVDQLQTVYSEEGLSLSPPAGFEQWTDRSVALSLEALAEYDPDHIFLLLNHGDETAEAYLEELEGNAVWNTISAVKNGNIYVTDRSIFAFNAPISTQYGADFLVDKLAK